MLESLRLFFKGAFKGVRRMDVTFIAIAVFTSLFLMVIPALQWSLQPDRSLLYNVLNTFVLPFLLILFILIFHHGLKNYKKKKGELNQIIEFITESMKKISFAPFLVRFPIYISMVAAVLIIPVFIFHNYEIRFSFLTEIILAIISGLLFLVPVIVTVWIVDYVRFR